MDQHKFVSIKLENTRVNVSLLQRYVSIHFVSSTSLQLQPDLQEFVDDIMKQNGFDRYKVSFKDRNKKVNIASKDDGERDSVRTSSSINVKV